MPTVIPGLENSEACADFLELEVGGDGMWQVGRDGVRRILTTRDRKVEFIAFRDRTLAYVKSSMGYPAIYPVPYVSFTGPAEAILMDLDGTSVRSEPFWIWIIQQTIARLIDNPRFELAHEDEPHVSGHSVSEHLQYCIEKYAPGYTVEEARRHYFDITRYELSEITAGRGHVSAFLPSPGLKEFLLAAKGAGIRIGLVTSGLHEKAWPSILSVFRTLELGDPLDFYDCIITAGTALRKGQAGTLGELCAKPHPFLYAETARVGLGVPPERRHRVIGIEDSCAGVVAIRLAGFAAIGVEGGNIRAGGTTPLLWAECRDLTEVIPLLI